MGIAANISFSEYPKQTDWVGRRVRVCFHYDTRNQVGGEIIRDDKEEPFRLIIKLNDGRFVLASECMYSLES